MKIKIAKKWVGENSPVFIIAEAGINHNGNLKLAKKMVTEAKHCEADAIKFQTFKAQDLASKKSKYYNIFKNLEFDENEFGEISDFCKTQGIIFCSSPFSERAVDLLVSLKVPLIKIASGDLTDTPLIKYAASKKKPIIISTGMANLNEIRFAIKSITSQKNNQIIIMHSVSAYPTPPEETNLKVLRTLKKSFRYPIGYSDNGPNLLVPLVAISQGANIIEKHFTLDRKMKGPDHHFSADPLQLKELVESAREIRKILGDGKKRCQPSEMENRIAARRSLVANIDFDKGTIITKDLVGIKRPAIGIEPKFIHKVIGLVSRKNIKIDESLKWKDLKKK